MHNTLVIEFKLSAVPPGIMAVLSIPGREGTVTRTWHGKGSGGRITAPQLDDLRAWADSALVEFVLSRSGVQELLEGL